jgi:hypothetical protein
LAELDWALANMGGSKRGKGKAASEIIEADAKVGKEDVYWCSYPARILLINFEQQGNLRGLGALLFDDGRNDPYFFSRSSLITHYSPPTSGTAGARYHPKDAQRNRCDVQPLE